MKINCLSCGHKIEIDAAYDTYAGPIKCYACGGLLEIETDSGSVKAVRFAGILVASARLENLKRSDQ